MQYFFFPFYDSNNYCDQIHEISFELLMETIIAGVPGEKPQVTSDKLPDSPSKFPCIQL